MCVLYWYNEVHIQLFSVHVSKLTLSSVIPWLTRKTKPLVDSERFICSAIFLSHGLTGVVTGPVNIVNQLFSFKPLDFGLCTQQTSFILILLTLNNC